MNSFKYLFNSTVRKRDCVFVFAINILPTWKEIGKEKLDVYVDFRLLWAVNAGLSI